jgi:hypothetical protein
MMFALALLLPMFVVVNAVPSFGIQSGGGYSGATFDGSTYAGAISYDADRDVVFVTGATYSPFFDISGTATTASTSSDCFLSIISLPTAMESGGFLYKERYGTTGFDESCSSLIRAGSKIYIGGQSEEGGLLTGLRSDGSNTALQYGTVLDIDVDLQSDEPTTALLGGRLLHYTAVQSSRAMVLSPTGNSIFVVSQESDLVDQNADFDPNERNPNLVDQQKWGSNFVLNVIMFDRKTGRSLADSNQGTTFDSASWNRQIATHQKPVDIAGIALFSSYNRLLVAGSAIGSNEDSIPISITDDWEGFMTLLDANTGAVTKSERIETQYGKITRVEGICKHPDLDDVVYLVGSTNGEIELFDYQKQELTAFILSVKIPDLVVTWSKQLDAKSGPLSINSNSAEMVGHACAVTDEGVYVGGVVKDGSIVNDEIHYSAGQDDIWVGLINSTTQQFSWTRQLGTPGNEHLSALEVDKNGDVLVVGNSDGSFMREKNEGDPWTDIFLLRLTKLDGQYPVPFSDENHPFPDDTNNQQPSPSSSIDSPDAPSSAPDVIVPAANSSSDGGGSNAGVVAVVVVMSAILLIISCFAYKRRHRDHHAETDSKHIERYVGTFDDVEVELKHSATGGWHGTYVNHDGGPRYFSDDGMPGDDFITFSGGEMSSLTHSAIIQDSLFSLDDEEPALGAGALGAGEFHQRQSSYRGLVDVYKNYDLSHHRLPSVARPRAMVDVDIDDEQEELHHTQWGREII